MTAVALADTRVVVVNGARQVGKSAATRVYRTSSGATSAIPGWTAATLSRWEQTKIVLLAAPARFTVLWQ